MLEYLEIGKIVNTYGIKGYVKVIPLTDDLMRFKKLRTVYLEYQNKLIEMPIEDVSYSKNFVLVKFKGLQDINLVEKYKNCYLKVNRKDAVKLPENSYFIVDLIGLEVYTEDGRFLGKIEDIFKTGSNDVYVVKNELGKQILLPAIASVIKQIDLSQRKVIVNLIKGLE